MTEVEWCDFNDMPKAGCSHCQGVPELDDNGKPELDDIIIVAKKDGHCSECGDPIVAGEDHIGRIAHEPGCIGELCVCWTPWIHYGCGR